MRRYIQGGGGGMGRGSGGGMLRAFNRVVRAGGAGGVSQSTGTKIKTKTTSPRSPTNYKPTSPNTLLLSSNNLNNPFSSYPFDARALSNCSSPTNYGSFVDDFGEQWECIDQEFEDVGSGCDEHFVFGSVPSPDEVQHAVSSLQQVLEPGSCSQLIEDRAAYDPDKDAADHITSPTGLVCRVPSVGSEVDWIEPSQHIWNSGLLKTHGGSEKVYNALHLLQTEPSVQRMVLALSSDKTVWDAVLNNEVVRELRDSFDNAVKNVAVNADSEEGSDDPKPAMDILGWIFTNSKAHIMNLVDKLTKMVNELFLPPESEKTMEEATDPFEEKLRTSFMISVVVFIVVVVTRASQA